MNSFKFVLLAAAFFLFFPQEAVLQEVTVQGQQALSELQGGGAEGMQSSQALARPLSGKEYFVGPGDVIILGIWGESNFTHTLTVTPEGKVIVPAVGEFTVAGLNLEQLREKMSQEINRVFHSVRVTVTLSRLRLFEVYVLGGVKNPGIYLATAVDHVSELILKAGGLQANSSQRRIEIRRGGKVFKRADLFRFYVLGDLEANPPVKDGDVIFVPEIAARAEINGAVYVPGTYEILQGETLIDLVDMARGLRPGASLDSVEVARFTQDNISIERNYVNLRNLYASNDPAAVDNKIVLDDGDRVFVRSIPKWHYKRSVSVKGEVRYPGVYPINKDETKLSDLIKMAGGFTSEASLEEAKVVRNIGEVLQDPEFERLKKIPPSEMTETEYEYFKMRSREMKGQMVVDFERLFNYGDKTQDIILKTGDLIIVPKLKSFVNVTGQVAFPGYIRYNKSYSVEDYVNRAGGYAWNARKGKTRVIKAKTGEWLWKKEAKELEPGDTIWVPEKPERHWWKVASEIMTAAAQAATVYVVVQNALQK